MAATKCLFVCLFVCTFHCLAEIQTEGMVCGDEAGTGIRGEDGNHSPEREGDSPPVHRHPKINMTHFKYSENEIV